MLTFIVRFLLIISAYLLICAMAYLGFITSQYNLVGWYLLITAIAYGLGGPFLLLSHMKKEPLTRQESQDLSFWLVIPGFLFAYFASPIEYIYLPEFLPGSRTLVAQIAGLTLITLSLLLFISARLELKGLYSGRLRVMNGHHLVTHGPYRLVRHPAYAAFILMGMGISIGFSSLVGFLAIPLLLVPGLVYKIAVEEKLLTLEFGEQYLSYSKVTKKLIPWIW